MYIKINVKNKIAALQDDTLIINGNSDYVIQFTFDAEWAPYETKTARFVTARGYTDVVFSGDEVALPVIADAISVRVGVYAGNLHTTTPAVIFCRRCITDGSGSPVEPTPDVYAQIMERLNNLDGATPATAEKLGVVKIGDNLKITEDGVLSVDTAEAVEQDNTKPITSATVYTAKSNIEALLGNLSELETEAKNNLVAAINEAAQSGGGGSAVELDTTLTQSGKAADAKAVGDALAKINNTKMEEVTETVTVGSENVTLDSGAPSQTVNLAWNVPGSKTIPPFTNYYIEKSGISYPRAFNTSGYTQFWSNSAAHGNSDAFVSGHQYFQAFHYIMDGDSTAEISTNGGPTFITPTTGVVISGSGWVYMLGVPTAPGAVIFNLSRTNTGTGTIDYVYCIDVTALQEAGTITATTVNELAELFGGLELIPGQDYAGSVTSGMATLSITRDGEITTVDSGTATATVQGGDILSAEGGSVTFLLKVLREVYVDPPSVWSGKKWVAFGDSLTDETINADKKYYRYIEEKTGITVVVMGAGGTGYYKTYDRGTAYGQRMANVPADADIITIFGSVNDWHTKTAGVAMGNASDTMEAGTLAGYINECIDVAIEKAPYAQIALVTPMDYKGLPSDTLEGIANIIKAVAAYRQIKCLDLYHESGFRVRNPIFAAVYTTDYSETAESYGHPSNLAHEQLIAPEFMELLKRMLLTA